MPAKKRSSSENLHDDDEESPQRHCRGKQSRRERRAQGEEEEREEEQVEDEEEEESGGDEEDEEDSSDESVGDPEDLPEFLDVKLTEVRKDVQCPICLGIIKKTRTVMECMHRFCRECIDKSMRLGNNECPACRTHCASRRSLRDDPRFDALIECLYPDIEKYEEEELAFHEEERNRNKQIQESIAQIFQRQSEALIKRRRKGKDQAPTSKRPTRNYQNPYSRRKRNSGSIEIQGSDGNEDEENGNKDSCSTDEQETETKRRRYTRQTRSKNSDGGCAEKETDASKESRGSMEGLAWGRGGARSHARHGSGTGSKATRSTTRLSKLADYLQSLQENGDKYVGHVRAEDGKNILVKEEILENDGGEDPAIINNNTSSTPAAATGIQNIEAQESLGALKANITSSSRNHFS